MKELILLLTREQGGRELVQISYRDYLNMLSDIKKSSPLNTEIKETYDIFVENYVRELVISRIYKVLRDKNIPKNSIDADILKLLRLIIKTYTNILQGKIVVSSNHRIPVKILRNYNLDQKLAQEHKIPQKLKKGEIVLMPLKIALPLYTLGIVEVEF